MDQLEEQNLILECQEGNLGKFGALYDSYAEKIYRYLYWRLRHRETAQDLTSQAFFKALEGIKSFNADKGYFSSWLYSIARNCLIDHWRKQKIHFNIDDLWAASSDENVAGEALIKEKIRLVRESLKELEAEQREIVIMKLWDGMTHKEISEILGRSEASVKMTFSRAIAKLRKEEILALMILFFVFNRLV